MNYRPIHCLTIALFLAMPTISWAIVTSDMPGSHVVTPGEPMFGVNLDGVVKIGYDVVDSTSIDDVIGECTGALITDRHVLTAAHCFDWDYNGQVDSIFIDFPFNDLEFPVVAGFELADRSVLIGLQMESIRFHPAWPETEIDLAVIELTEDAPANIPRYPIYSHGADTGLPVETGLPIVIAGYGWAGHGSTGADVEDGLKRAGLNRYEGLFEDIFLAYDFDSGLVENDWFSLVDIDSDLGFGIDEANTGDGDSGGPSFIDGAIAGVHSAGIKGNLADVTEPLDGSWGEGGYDVAVAHYGDFLLEATDGQVVFVPEPSTWILLLNGSLLVGWRQVIKRRSPGKQ